jgi:hypothetical protein
MPPYPSPPQLRQLCRRPHPCLTNRRWRAPTARSPATPSLTHDPIAPAPPQALPRCPSGRSSLPPDACLTAQSCLFLGRGLGPRAHQLRQVHSQHHCPCPLPLAPSVETTLPPTPPLPYLPQVEGSDRALTSYAKFTHDPNAEFDPLTVKEVHAAATRPASAASLHTPLYRLNLFAALPHPLACTLVYLSAHTDAPWHPPLHPNNQPSVHARTLLQPTNAPPSPTAVAPSPAIAALTHPLNGHRCSPLPSPPLRPR